MRKHPNCLKISEKNPKNLNPLHRQTLDHNIGIENSSLFTPRKPARNMFSPEWLALILNFFDPEINMVG